MADLGDLSEFMKEGSGGTLSDLNWLDVNEKDYRELDTLPKQNLDVQPDLLSIWDRQDKPSTTYLIPNKQVTPDQMNPNTMGDMSREHGDLRSRAEEIRKLARFTLMQSPDPRKLRAALVAKFDLESLRVNKDVLAEVLQERGLLGKLYVAAKDFHCQGGSPAPAAFVRKFAESAPFVLSKEACGGCCHAKKNPIGSGSTCSVFHKEIQLEVPYTDQLADKVEQLQRAKGAEVPVTASKATPKERIRLAMLAADGSRAAANGTYNGEGMSYIQKPLPSIPAPIAEERLIQASDLLRKKTDDTAGAAYARPILAFLRREMLKGLSVPDIAKSLKLAFNQADLVKARAHWEPLFKEAGLFGALYSTQEAFDDCAEGANFLASRNPMPRAIVAGPKCARDCNFNKAGRCLMYGKKLIADASELYTPQVVDQVMTEHRTAGRLQAWDTKVATTWGTSPREQLQSMNRAAMMPQVNPATAPTRANIFKAFVGGGQSEHTASEITKQKIAQTTRRYMNEGLYGNELLSLLRANFDPRDLKASVGELTKVLAEQGLQGIYYVDPTVYSDYGSGCDEAMRLHRSRLVPSVKIGPKCGSCVLQTQPGFCSKLAKPLVVEPDYADKAAQQREILASGPSMHIGEQGLAGLINNGHTMMAEYELQQQPMEFDLNASEGVSPIDIEFANQKL